MNDPLTVELPLDSLNAVLKAVGISLSKIANKLPKLHEGRVLDEARHEYEDLLHAQEELSDVQSRALLGHG